VSEVDPLIRFRRDLIVKREGVRDAQDQAAFPQAFKQQIIELPMAGRTPDELSPEFGSSAQSDTAWIARAAADAGKPVRGKDVLSSAEREGLARLLRENKRLQSGEVDLALACR
jgi:transposase-like protein